MNLKKRLLHLTFLLSITLFVSSCRKSDSAVPTAMPAIPDVVSWLETKRVPGQAWRNSRLEILRNNLDMSAAEIISSDNGTFDLMVPIRPAFDVQGDSRKRMTIVLLLKVESDGEISYGKIVRAIPEAGTEPVSDAAAFQKIAKLQRVEFNGTCEVSSITDVRVFEALYKDDQVVRTVTTGRKPDEVMTARMVCTDFYSFTAIIQNGVIIQMTFIYSHTECKDDEEIKYDELWNEANNGPNPTGSDHSNLPVLLVQQADITYSHGHRPTTYPDGRQTRNATMEWIFCTSIYGPYSWEYKHTVVATQEKLPGGVWKFKSIIQNGVISYYNPLDCLTPGLTLNTEQITIAPDELSLNISLGYSATATYTCTIPNTTSTAQSSSLVTWLAN